MKSIGSVFIANFLLMAILSGCMKSIARYSEFPESAESINYEGLSTINKNKSPLWTTQGINEYYAEVPIIQDSLLVNALKKAMESRGYQVQSIDLVNKKIMGERGMRPNEWRTIAGAYFTNQGGKSLIYIRCQISQDATGGWRENRAKKIYMAFAAKI